MTKIVVSKTLWQKLAAMSKKRPLIRGMASYCMIWPMGSLIQQTLEGREHYDLMRVLRFSVYGALYVAPTLTAWLTVARHMYPQNNLSSALAKVNLSFYNYL